jgi:transcription initiation factor TFIIIB Brf1 subunit/transcription initiation factor TFIIB
MVSCPNCPGAQVEYDNATGSSYCTICGTVSLLSIVVCSFFTISNKQFDNNNINNNNDIMG